MRQNKWPIVSACHAGRLGDHRTPVGSVDYFLTFLVLLEHLCFRVYVPFLRCLPCLCLLTHSLQFVLFSLFSRTDLPSSHSGMSSSTSNSMPEADIFATALWLLPSFLHLRQQAIQPTDEPYRIIQLLAQGELRLIE